MHQKKIVRNHELGRILDFFLPENLKNLPLHVGKSVGLHKHVEQNRSVRGLILNNDFENHYFRSISSYATS